MLRRYGGTAHKLSSQVLHFKEFVGSVRVDFLDSFWGATGFFNVMMQKFYFVFAAALLHKVDLVILSMQKNEVHGVIRDSLFYFHPAPRFVKEC